LTKKDQLKESGELVILKKNKTIWMRFYSDPYTLEKCAWTLRSPKFSIGDKVTRFNVEGSVRMTYTVSSVKQKKASQVLTFESKRSRIDSY